MKVGDKVKIHCNTERLNHIKEFYDNKIGTISNITKEYPWGNIVVKLENGTHTTFFENELELVL